MYIKSKNIQLQDTNLKLYNYNKQIVLILFYFR